MASAADYGAQIRDAFSSTGRRINGLLRRSARDVAVMVEERPEVGPFEMDLPYPIPTRDEPLAYVLFYVGLLTIVATITVVPATFIAFGEVPMGMMMVIGTIALVIGTVANLRYVAMSIMDNSTQLLKPLVGLGVPLLSALHYWFGPVLAVLGVTYVIVHPSNNILGHAAAVVIVVWTATGLLLKLQKDSPWNGKMLQRWAGALHKRPFVYIALIATVTVSAFADYVY
jgi:hypothetical protein